MLCPYCERKCRLDGDAYGFCRMYESADGAVRERFPDRWCAYSISRVESIPFYHAYPGGRCMVVGTAGCNLDCRYCSNAYAAKEDPASLTDILLRLTPEALVGLAEKHGCHAIVFAINEPTVSLPTLLRVAKVAKAAGMAMGCLTNGYASPLGTEMLGEIFSFINVSLKGLSTDFCEKYLGIADSAPVIRNIRELSRRCHVEVTTPVIESENDHELDQMAALLAGIDPLIPWHVFRLLPVYKMSTHDYPGIEAINAKLVAHRKNLPYIYFHNFIGSRWVDTSCPGCGRTVITRHSLGCGGDKLDVFALNGDRCPECGRRIRLHGEKVTWNSKEVTA
jgi:pyruvate formate lyase activating enzyme